MKKNPATKQIVDQKIKRIKEFSSMNKDLEEWLKEVEKEGGLPKKIRKASFKEKKPQGRCAICDVNEAKFFCLKCGRAVCSSCYFSLVGLCEKCVSKATVEKWKKSKPDWEKVLGLEWVD